MRSGALHVYGALQLQKPAVDWQFSATKINSNCIDLQGEWKKYYAGKKPGTTLLHNTSLKTMLNN